MVLASRRLMEKVSNELKIVGQWSFSEGRGEQLADKSENQNDLFARCGAKWESLDERRHAISLDGEEQFLETHRPVVDTSKNFSVAAWVKLDQLEWGEGYAYTALSQGTGSHSNFYLGVRRNDELLPDGSIGPVYRWCFNIAPLEGTYFNWCFNTRPDDGLLTAKHGWKKAHSSRPISQDMIGKWVLLLGVCDVQRGIAELIVPTFNDRGSVSTPPGWKFWKADQQLQIGRAKWLGDYVDHWPGSIGEVFAWDGLISDQAIEDLHTGDPLLND